MSKNRKRVTTQQRIQRTTAARKSAEKRKEKSVVENINSLLGELGVHVPELFKLQSEFCPRATPPWGRSSSILALDHIPGNPPTLDPQIYGWLKELQFTLWCRVQEAKNMRVIRGQNLTNETSENGQVATAKKVVDKS